MCAQPDKFAIARTCELRVKALPAVYLLIKLSASACIRQQSFRIDSHISLYRAESQGY